MNDRHLRDGLRCKWPAFIIVLCAALSVWLPPARARTHTEIAQAPLFLATPEPPIAVIDMPKDQSLFKKAYNDYSDLNGDGLLEKTYNDSTDYYGYFDSGICYRYNKDSSPYFEPTGKAGGSNGHYCDGEHWSGNFLNWVSMSRMDILRKILYGGKRSTDTDTSTILERAYLPPDAHAWAKYYNGQDINKLTPFDPPTTPTSAIATVTPTDPSATTNKACRGQTIKFTFAHPVDNEKFQVGDQIKVESQAPAHEAAIGLVCQTGNDGSHLDSTTPSVTISFPDNDSIQAPLPAGTWKLTNLTYAGITFCNVSKSNFTTSQENKEPPVIRVAQGNYSLWASGPSLQCQWKITTLRQPNRFLNNGNETLFSGLNASAYPPSKSRRGHGDFNVRVQACVPGLIANQTCKRYPAGDYKPTGLLQQYGDDGTIRFALFTGSYNKNYSGGVLRANAENFADEVNVDTDGTFIPSKHRIVYTIDKLRIFGYAYQNTDSSHGYNKNYYGVGDNCTWQKSDPLVDPGEGNCRSWGNPLSEIYLESLRYLAGLDPTTDFLPESSVMDLPRQTWKDPLNSKNYCTSLNILTFSTSAPSYDDDQMQGLSNLGASKTAQDLTNEIGKAENINGSKWFIGNAQSDNDSDRNLCTAKTVQGLGEINGICPEGPSLHGSYLMAGAAWYAHTHRIRKGFKIPKTDNTSLKVNTLGVQLSSNTPKIVVNVNGHEVTILPAYVVGSEHATGTLVDFKVVRQTKTEGQFYINWEDSTQGGDYDQDAWGILKYRVNGNNITVTTDIISASTANPQGFGFISGTTQDGPHFMSGLFNFNYDDPTGAKGCNKCNMEDGPAHNTFAAGAAQAGTLKDPLYYTAKWGGFNTRDGATSPRRTGDWDANGDGQPDNYFYATNPLGLEVALGKALKNVSQNSLSSTAATSSNSSQLQTNSYIFSSRFSSADWHGELLAYKLDPSTGTPGAKAVWTTKNLLHDSANRGTAITWNGSKGVAAEWKHLSREEKLSLALPNDSLNKKEISKWLHGHGSLSKSAAKEAKDRLSYILGDREYEGKKYRTRNPDTILGDIVHSAPVYVGHQDFGYAGTRAPGASDYAAYVTKKKGSAPMIYVGANDGMLHGFEAKSGKEKFVYIPQGVYPKLSALTSPAYNGAHQYLVDGSSTIVDAHFNKSWGTYLVGTLGAGGKGIFALNVTPGKEFGSNSILWEFSSTRLDSKSGDITLQTPKLPTHHHHKGKNKKGYDRQSFADLGYSIPAPAAGLLRDRNGYTWAAIIANGYDSDSGTAALYIIDLKTGKLIRELDTGKHGPHHNNGLSSPTPVDVDGDHVIDYVYAGDLQGNLWRFDLTASDPDQWSVAGGGTPLFTACTNQKHCGKTRQPITAAPDVGAYPTGGVMVYIGTGKYIGRNDPLNTQTQSFYGIQDRSVVVGNVSAAGADFKKASRNKLLKQHFLTNGSGGTEFDTSTDTVRLVSNESIGSDNDGWVIDLPGAGERDISAPILDNGRILFTTMIPGTSPCRNGAGDSFLIALDAFDGGRLDFSPFDINHNRQFDSGDKVSDGKEKVYTSAIKSTVGVVPTPTLVNISTNKQIAITSGNNGQLEDRLLNRGPGIGPQSWRQLR